MKSSRFIANSSPNSSLRSRPHPSPPVFVVIVVIDLVVVIIVFIVIIDDLEKANNTTWQRSCLRSLRSLRSPTFLLRSSRALRNS